jgi:nitrite reductase/ring-hydroxylating ferredoxin subunit
MDTTRVALTELKDGVPHKVTVGETPIVLIRQGETVTALGGECPHAGAPLEEGVVCEGRLICPWHKAAFSVSDGSLVEPPALEGLARYAVRVEDGMAVVDGTTLPAGTPRADKTDGVIAIVGTGAAASGALALLMSRGHAGPVVLIGPEDGPPYDRTALSKMVVAGKMGPESKPVLPGELPPTVERVMGTVERIDPDARAIHLAGGRVVSYGRALVATGGTPKRPDLPGATLEGVHVLRGVADAKSLVEDLEGVKRVVVLGAGFIGLEAAAGLRAREIEVTVVDSVAVPLANVFGEAVGRRLRALHEEKGVVFRDGKIASFEGRARV